MEGYIDALELTVIANVTLVVLSLFFIVFTYCLQRVTGDGKKGFIRLPHGLHWLAKIRKK